MSEDDFEEFDRAEAGPTTDKGDKSDKKAEKKKRKQLEESMESGVPDPWQRYRALTDVLDTFNDISEMADRKTRFALVILGAMNTVNLLVVARPELFLGERTARDPALLYYLVVYVGLSLYLFMQAIGTLRPRVSTLFKKVDGAGSPLPSTAGLRFVGHVRDMSFEDYYAKWHQATYGDLNREVALSIQMVAKIVSQKYEALHRLYAGLMFLVILSAGLITVLSWNQIMK